MNGILQEKHGKYYVVLDFKQADGSRHRKWVSTGLKVAGNNARAAKKKLHEIVAEYQSNEQYLEKSDSFTEYIKQWLGHADITMTGNVYGHLFDGRKTMLAQQLEEKMESADS